MAHPLPPDQSGWIPVAGSTIVDQKRPGLPIADPRRLPDIENSLGISGIIAVVVTDNRMVNGVKGLADWFHSDNFLISNKLLGLSIRWLGS